MLSPHKKLLWKFILFELILLGSGVGIWFFLKDYILHAFIGIFVLSIAFFFIQISWPFNKILKEFKALLTGKQYRRIYTKKTDEIGVVAHFFNEITRSLERVSTDIKEHRRISSELNVAQKIQDDLLPKKAPPIKGLDIIARTKPAAEIGGDCFDFIKKGNQTFIYMGDVTGHGIPSGLVMMIVNTLIHTFADMVQDSKQLLVQVNKYLKPRIQRTMFMTMTMLRWDEENQQMFYTGAGHETILHYKKIDHSLENKAAGGIALGMVPNNEALLKEMPFPLSEGDFVILYSDGIIEGKNDEGERFEISRLIKIIEKNAPTAPTAEDLFRHISTELTRFLGDTVQLDDITLMVIRRGEPFTGTENLSIVGTKEASKSLIDYGNTNVEESGLKESN
ncbi:MAG: SpoIIE family protein phosphatase [Candidatus Gracilibacteria bacterium]